MLKLPMVKPDVDLAAARERNLARISRRVVHAYQHDLALHFGPTEVRLLVEHGPFAGLVDCVGEPTIPMRAHSSAKAGADPGRDGT